MPNSTAHPKPKGDLLVVDDTLDNLRLLSTMLTEQGYKVRSAINGQIAIMGIKAFVPDLILLDINMPEMNGYEVCQHLKADPETQDIPIIFISALGEALDKVKSFAVGGVDYITKPFQMEEVLVRIETHLGISRLQKQLQHQQQELQVQNLRLQQEVCDRQQAEIALRKAEEKYRAIVENAVEGIAQITIQGRFLSANAALARLLKYDSPAELMEKVTNVTKQLYVEPSRRGELAAYLQQYEEVSDFESEVYCKDGSTIWISENVRAVKDEEGRLLYFEGTMQDISERRQTEAELRQERARSEHLLLNILPQPIAQQLKGKLRTIADDFSEVTVLFADIVDFTQLSSSIPPTDLVDLLNQIFSAFDDLVVQRGLEKIKTIGDAYMVAGGLPVPVPDHIQAVADVALAMQMVIPKFTRWDGQPFQLRIGINTGPVVAGVIGRRKFAYDLWGDTVNVASRMESQGEPGKIQVTEAVFRALEQTHRFEKRGEISIKGKGEMVTYWLLDRLPQAEPNEDEG